MQTGSHDKKISPEQFDELVQIGLRTYLEQVGVTDVRIARYLRVGENRIPEVYYFVALVGGDYQGLCQLLAAQSIKDDAMAFGEGLSFVNLRAYRERYNSNVVDTAIRETFGDINPTIVGTVLLSAIQRTAGINPEIVRGGLLDNTRWDRYRNKAGETLVLHL